MNSEKLLSVEEAAEYFNVSRRKLYVLLESQQIPHYRIGRRGYRFDLVELKKYFATQPRPSREAKSA
jgi:excisionase family DNA binding protein